MDRAADRARATDAVPDRNCERQPEVPSERAVRLGSVPIEGLNLPRTETRQSVTVDERTYQLRASESAILATVGAFRVVPETDLQLTAGERTLPGDVRNLSDQNLLERHGIVVNGHPTRVLVLTKEAKALLDAHQDSRDDGRKQEYHAGLVKPRELAHDAQLYRLYRAEAARIQAQGGRVRRVVLDYELKRDYQRYLNRSDRPAGISQEDDRWIYAAQAQLPIVDGCVELPDLRIEFETPDGTVSYRDVELITEHYSRSQFAVKARAGFSMYRAAGSRLRGRRGATQGGSPVDPHHLEWLR